MLRLQLSYKGKALLLSGLAVLITVLGDGLVIGLLQLENRHPTPRDLFGAPNGYFNLMISLSGLLALVTIAFIWFDYAKHENDEKLQHQLELEVSRRTEQLLVANEQLRKVDKLKTELIHRVSHELRTPLTSIVGYAEVLLDGKAGGVNELQENFLQTLQDNAIRLQKLVDEILEISRWESGAQQLHLAKVDLRQVVQTTIDTILPSLERSRLQLETEIPETLPLVNGDEEKLLQMTSNILDNAVKYTPPGGTVRLKLTSDKGRVNLTIEDTGVGIPKDFLPHLFDKFERAPNVNAPMFSGTGLGLYLVKQIIDAHGGNIRVESELNRGTRVRISLPLQSLSPREDAKGGTEKGATKKPMAIAGSGME